MKIESVHLDPGFVEEDEHPPIFGFLRNRRPTMTIEFVGLATELEQVPSLPGTSVGHAWTVERCEKSMRTIRTPTSPAGEVLFSLKLLLRYVGQEKEVTTPLLEHLGIRLP